MKKNSSIETFARKILDRKEEWDGVVKSGLGFSSGLRQIGRALDFESPVRISNSIIIGDCSIGAFSYIGSGSEIRNTLIGRFCSIAANVATGPAEHPVDWLSSHPFQFNGVRYFEKSEDWGKYSSDLNKFEGNSGRTKIGNDVWIGRNSIIRQGVSVGDGAIVAGGAFVNKDVPPYAIVAGVPAKIIRYRFDSLLIEKMLNVCWWDWEICPDKHGIDFSEPELAIDLIKNLIDSEGLSFFSPKKYRLRAAGAGAYEMFDLI